MTTKLWKSTLIIVLVLCSFSCSVEKYVNKKFPKLSTVDQQVNALNQNQKTLDSLDPSIGIFLDSSILDKYLPGEIQRSVEALNTPELVVHEFKPQVFYVKQGIRIKTGFSISMPEHHVSLIGKMDGVTSISTLEDTLYLRTAFSSLKISDVNFNQKPGLKKRAIAKLLVPILKHFIENVNGKYLKDPTAIHMGWGTTVSFDPKNMLAKDGVDVSGQIVEVSRYLNRSSILIDKMGILVMIELDDKELNAVSDKPKFSNNRSQTELNQKFKGYKNEFTQLWNNSFDPVDESVGVSVMVSKNEVAKLFNNALSNGFNLKQNISIPAISFNSKVEVKESKINCNKVRTKFSHPGFNGDSCNWKCKKFLGVEEPFCVASREACKVKRETARIAWQTGRETARIAHQLKNETAVAGCKLLKEANNFMNLGRFKGGSSGSGHGNISFKDFNFSEDLSSLTFRQNGSIKLTFDTTLRLRPQDIGHIFLCNTNYDKKVSSSLKATIPDQKSTIDITAKKNSKNLDLIIEFSDLNYKASLSPSPLHKYLTDPLMIAKCPVFSSLLGVLSIGTATGNLLNAVSLDPEIELLLYGKTKGKFKIKSMRQTFEPIQFSLGSIQKIDSQIIWGKKSINFTHYEN